MHKLRKKYKHERKQVSKMTRQDILVFRQKLIDLQNMMLAENYQEPNSPTLYASISNMITELQQLTYTDLYGRLKGE